MSLNITDLFKISGTILLLGETGVGKSYLAKTIHQNSCYRGHNFVVSNLATTKEDLLESELFGHIRGSFTGAIRNRKGAAETTGKGTLFLDEIGELSLSAQKKLLMLLDEQIFFAVGDEHPKKFSGRVIAATNKNLPQMVQEGSFRQDLFYRLNVFTYTIPPLRSSPEELCRLVHHFFSAFKQKQGRHKLHLDENSKQMLQNHSWPGNIRELKNCMEYLVSITPPEATLTSPSDLPEWCFNSRPTLGLELLKHDSSTPSLQDDYPSALAEFEKVYFTHVLHKFSGRINLTANKINISKATLISKAKKYGINTLLLRAQA
ncbi:MAG: sigma-54-dependent Fis family transcriptional regulator [Oligoflexia bacterium]|nr:sigma-54-dependent Fis family transcriptional regulator [Oligoflexia bacterium]